MSTEGEPALLDLLLEIGLVSFFVVSENLFARAYNFVSVWLLEQSARIDEELGAERDSPEGKVGKECWNGHFLVDGSVDVEA